MTHWLEPDLFDAVCDSYLVKLVHEGRRVGFFTRFGRLIPDRDEYGYEDRCPWDRDDEYDILRSMVGLNPSRFFSSVVIDD